MTDVAKTAMAEREVDSRLFINVLRGIAIFLMLWGHCIQCCCGGSFDFFNNGVFKVIYSFHMPLFMLISGYLFYFSAKKRTFKEILVHRAQSMLQPIFLGAILCFLLLDVALAAVEGNFMKIFRGDWLSHLTDFWFLWSVLSASVIVAIAYKATRKKWLTAIILLLGFLFVYTMPCAQLNIYMYPYFVIGFLFSKWQNTPWLQKLSKLKYLSLIAFPVMMLFFKKEHYIYTSGFHLDRYIFSNLPVYLFRWAIGLVGSIFAIVILELVVKLTKRIFAKSFVTVFFENLGKFSLHIYVLSIVFLSGYLPIIHYKITSLLGSNLFANNMIIYNFVFTPILAVLFALALLLITRIFEKAKINKILFGK